MEQVNRLGGRRKDNTMTLDRIDASPNRNEGEDWHCPDCQSWGPFTVDVTTRVILSEEGTPFLEDEGGRDYDDMVFARCPDCQRQAPVASFRCEPAMMKEVAGLARARGTREGVDPAPPDQMVADFTATPQRGAWVGPFQIPDESPIVGTERTPA
jgi:hypothetical protein